MLTALLAMVTIDVGALLWMFVGVCVVFAIVFFLMRQMGAPAVAFTVLYVIGGIILLLLAINFFFGSPRTIETPSVIVR